MCGVQYSFNLIVVLQCGGAVTHIAIIFGKWHSADYGSVLELVD